MREQAGQAEQDYKGDGDKYVKWITNGKSLSGEGDAHWAMGQSDRSEKGLALMVLLTVVSTVSDRPQTKMSAHAKCFNLFIDNCILYFVF